MNNAVFGKFLQNVRTQRDIKLVTDEKYFKKQVAKPNFKSAKIFDENLVSVELGKLEVVLNRPIYVGFAILDLSKVLMYRHFYEYYKPKYGENVELPYMDTDSY